MTRVLALTFGDESQASTFFRVHQYIKPLARLNIHLEAVRARKFDKWPALPSYDAVVLQKSLLPVAKLRRLRRLARRLVFDIDDAIWHPHSRKHFFMTNLRQNFRLRTIVGSADLCTAANEVIARHLRRWTQRVATIPMALDENQWASPERESDRVRVGWSGNPVNLHYLEAIGPALAEVQARFPEAEFAVFSGQRPEFCHVKFTLLPFAAGREPEVIRSFDIGLLPLPDNPFAAGKSPIKGLQYMACGAAVVLSPVGAAAEMFIEGKTALFASNREGWIDALTRLIRNAELRRILAGNARKEFAQRFSLSANLPRLAAALSGRAELLSQLPINAQRLG